MFADVKTRFWSISVASLALSGLVLVFASCGEDSGPPSAPPPVGDTETDTGDKPDTVDDTGPVVVPPAPGPCQLLISTPEADAHLTASILIEGLAAHADLGMSHSKAAVQKCDGGDPFVFEDNPSSTWAEDGKTFTFEWDSSEAETGEYCITLVAFTTLPGDAPVEWEAPTCLAERRFFLDNDAPAVSVTAPVNSGVDENGSPVGDYLKSMPLTFQANDHTQIASIRLLTGDGEELKLFELENEGVGLQSFDEILNACEYGGNVGGFTLELVDTLGNVREEILTPNILRCPLFVSAHYYPSPDKGQSIHIVEYDYDGDGDKDLLSATKNSGILLYLNDGEGRFVKPESLPGITGSVSFFVPDDYNDDGILDLLVVHDAGAETAVTIYLWSSVCEPDPLFNADELLPEELPTEHPVVCEPSYGPAQALIIPSKVTALHYAHLAADPEADVDLGKRKDVLLGTEKEETALAVLLRAEASDIAWTPADGGDDQSSHACTYWPRRWNLGGELLEPLEHEVSTCFRTPRYHASIGRINAIALGDFVEDETNALDVVVSRENHSSISIFQHDGAGKIKAAFTWAELPSPASGVIPGYFNDDGAGAVQHTDLMIVIPDAGQIWQIFGTGDGNFQLAAHPQSGQPYTLRRAICIEGRPVSAELLFLDDFDDPQNSSFDLVIANQLTGTIWTKMGAGGLSGSGLVFSPPQIVQALREPQQVRITHLNEDPYYDAIVRGKAGDIAVLFGATPPSADVPSTSPNAGPKGTFVGAVDLPTPIPYQALGATHDCEVSTQGADGSASLGSPESRLTPEFMAVADFDNDDKLDLVIAAKASGVTGSEGDQAIPLLTFRSDGILPREFIQQSDSVPLTSFCLPDFSGAEVEECEETKGESKGDMTAMVPGTFDVGGTVDLAMTTATFYPSTDDDSVKSDYPDIPTVDVLFNLGDSIFDQLTGTSSNPQYADAAGLWYDYGILAGSRPLDVAIVHCNFAGEQLSDLAIISERQTESETRSRVKVFQAIGNKTFNEAWNHTFNPGVEATSIVAGRVGYQEELLEIPGQPGDAPVGHTDLLVTTKTGVVLFEGVNSLCGFQYKAEVEVGVGVRSLAVRDLDLDGYADLVLTRTGGTVSVLYGIDGVLFKPPSNHLQMPNATLGDVEIADINGDGFRDILVLDTTGGTVGAFLGTGTASGFWPSVYPIPLGVGSETFMVRDLDLDGCQDVIGLSPTAKAATILRSSASAFGGCVPQLPAPL